MGHFKKLKSAAEADDVSNDDLISAAEKFPVQQWNFTNSVIRNYVSWLPSLKMIKPELGGIDWIHIEFPKVAPPNLFTFICILCILYSILGTGLNLMIGAEASYRLYI